MSRILRIVLDTNVIVSAALLPKSVSRIAFDAATENGKLLISAETLLELDEVLRRPKFNKYVAETLRLDFMAALVRIAEIVPITERISDCRDHKDNKFLELAVSGGASHLLTGDADLLDLQPYRGIDIFSPAVFLEWIRTK